MMATFLLNIGIILMRDWYLTRKQNARLKQLIQLFEDKRAETIPNLTADEVSQLVPNEISQEYV